MRRRKDLTRIKVGLGRRRREDHDEDEESLREVKEL
jgi:hypothetical protein